MEPTCQIDGDKISIVEEDFVQSDVAIESDNYERNESMFPRRY